MANLKKYFLVSTMLLGGLGAYQANAYGGLVFVGQGSNAPSAHITGPSVSINGPTINAQAPSVKSSASFGLPSITAKASAPAISIPKPTITDSAFNQNVTSSAFGSVPLWLAAQQVVPPSYKVNFAKTLNQKQSVSWVSGKSVKATLDNISDQIRAPYSLSGNTITFGDPSSTTGSDADTLNAKALKAGGGVVPSGAKQATMTVNQKPVKEVYTSEEHGHHAKGKHQGYPTSENQLPTHPFAPADGGNGIYYAPVHSNLASVIESWAARSGWSVVNDTDDIYYPLMASASFKGSFTESVTSIINSFSDASPYPRVTFYPNHVMRIYTSESSDE